VNKSAVSAQGQVVRPSAYRQHWVFGVIKHLFFQMESDFGLGISKPYVLLRQGASIHFRSSDKLE